MHFVLEFIVTLVLFTFHMVYGFFKAVLPISRKKSLSGQKILITGAGSGLGRMMSNEFAKRGCTLVLWDINREGNEETAEQVRRCGVSAYTYVCDLSVRDAIYKCADKVKKDVGDIDILVNNAGIVTGKKFLESSDSLIEKTMDVNIRAHFWTVKSFLPPMLEKNHGHIVTIASSAGLFGVTGLADYCASKFAAVGFDESLRNEIQAMGKTGVNTTVVCPTFINTGMFQGVQMRSLMPMLTPELVIERIMLAIETNQEVLYVPRTVYVMNALKALLPRRCGDVISKALRMDNTMDNFVGREKQQ